MSLNYKNVEGFSLAIEEKGFDNAAKKLGITQSALSQRIKTLENDLGTLLITRTSPPVPTNVGRKLLTHFRKVSFLKSELDNKFNPENKKKYQLVSLATDTDCLSTWFYPVIERMKNKHNILCEVKLESGTGIIGLLKAGEVMGCISTDPKAIQGCSATCIGEVEYCLAATPSFSDKYFHNGFNREVINRTPAIISNGTDGYLSKILQRFYNFSINEVPCIHIPSLEIKMKLILNDTGYGVIPIFKKNHLIDSGQICPLNHSHSMIVKLYWHRWRIKSVSLDYLSNEIGSIIPKKMSV